ncbi:PAS domain S-box protein [Aeromonas veronii]
MFKQIKKSNIYTKKIESNYSYDRLKAINFAYGIVEFDMNAVITSVNDFFAGIFGYKCEELIGKSHSVLLSPAQIEGHNVWWGEIVSGAIVSGEFCRLNKYGEDVWIQASYTRITDKDGVFLGVIKIATDITNRKKLESEYQSLLRAIDRSLGVIEFALNGEIIAFNSIYQELTGYQRDELLGQHHSVLCYPEYVMSKAYLDFWVQLSRGESISGRFSRVNKSGHAFWIHATYSPILSPDGEILRIIKYAHDITEQVEAEATVSKQKDLLDLILMLDRLFIKRCDLNILYNLMFDRLFSIAKCELGLIVLTNKSNDGYSAYARSNDMKIWQGIITGVDNKESQGQCGRGKKINIFNEVLIKNKVVFSNEIIDWTDCRQFSREFPIFECFVGMPINHDGNVIGMLALANKIGGFNEGIVTFLEPLLSTLSTFIYAIKLEVERQRIESILRFDSEHDALTFLPNRNFFSAELVS